MAPNLFRILLVIVALYALLRGQRDEKQVGIILVLGVIASELAWSPVHQRFSGIETSVMLVDIAVFGGFLWVAMRTDRFWPLWIAGLQLTTILGHLLKLLDTSLFPKAYGAALVFWVYPMLLILAIGTWRNSRRVHGQAEAAPA